VMGIFDLARNTGGSGRWSGCPGRSVSRGGFYVVEQMPPINMKDLRARLAPLQGTTGAASFGRTRSRWHRKRHVCEADQLGLRIRTSQPKTRRSGSVYLTSGAGAAAENARSNVARSALGKSETAT